MATQDPISGLTALGGAPASGDLLVLTDISDTSQSANGTTKNMTVANLFTAPTMTGTTTLAAVAATSCTLSGALVLTGPSNQVTIGGTAAAKILFKNDNDSKEWLVGAGGSVHSTDFVVFDSTAGATRLSIDTVGVLTVSSAVLTGTLGVTGAATAASLAVTGGLTSSGPTGTGIGYATGAGGTVTQATSFSTAVTINKLAGQITTQTAPTTSTPVSFVVNNSTVAATDTIIINIQSGWQSNLHAEVTAVANGSFTITAEAIVGGPSTTLVINFAVLKSVAA